MEQTESHEVPYFCRYCDFLSTSYTHMMEHRIIHTVDLDKILDKHVKKEPITKEKFMCHLCPREFDRIGILNTHIRNVHCKTKKCPLCEKKYKRTTNLNDHIKGVHNKVRHFCDQCEASYTLDSSLKQHKINVHGKGRKPFKQRLYPCQKCNVKFQLKHTDCKSHKAKCEKCGFIASHKDYLKRHQTGPMCHPDKLLQKHYICEECSKAFTTEKYKEKHRKQHMFGKPYKCGLCGTGFTNSWVLTKHIKKDICKAKKSIHPDTA